uniref:Copper transporter n=1 Tax=Heterorhabditis bacteriophora TaxID=37862 RepID=A0A1I7WVQ3_HETBA
MFSINQSLFTSPLEHVLLVALIHYMTKLGVFQMSVAKRLFISSVRNKSGKPFVLPSVREAEQQLVSEKLDKEYAGIAGVPTSSSKATIYVWRSLLLRIWGYMVIMILSCGYMSDKGKICLILSIVFVGVMDGFI